MIDHARRTASAFFKGSTFLDYSPNRRLGAYEFEINDVWEAVTGPDSEVELIKHTVAGFVGAVTFALAAAGEIDPATATPTEVADVCFHLGRLTQTRFIEETTIIESNRAAVR